MDDTGNNADNSAKDATHSISSDEQAAVKEAFSRLGIDIDDAGNSESKAFIAALNGVADKIEAQDAEIAKLKSAKDAAQKRARAAEAAAPDKVRKIGRMNFPDGAPTPAELREALAGAETVEVVLSDGKSEIAGVAPRSITGDAWEDVPSGLKLRVPELLVHGPGLGSPKASYAVAGYGLVIDGKQVAWSQRADGQLTIGAGSTFDLKDDVIF